MERPASLDSVDHYEVWQARHGLADLAKHGGPGPHRTTGTAQTVPSSRGAGAARARAAARAEGAQNRATGKAGKKGGPPKFEEVKAPTEARRPVPQGAGGSGKKGRKASGLVDRDLEDRFFAAEARVKALDPKKRKGSKELSEYEALKAEVSAQFKARSPKLRPGVRPLSMERPDLLFDSAALRARNAERNRDEPARLRGVERNRELRAVRERRERERAGRAAKARARGVSEDDLRALRLID